MDNELQDVILRAGIIVLRRTKMTTHPSGGSTIKDTVENVHMESPIGKLFTGQGRAIEVTIVRENGDQVTYRKAE